MITEVKLKPEALPCDVCKTEDGEPLKYAVVYRGDQIIALFNQEYWAKEFVAAARIGFTIREVAE